MEKDKSSKQNIIVLIMMGAVLLGTLIKLILFFINGKDAIISNHAGMPKLVYTIYPVIAGIGCISAFLVFMKRRIGIFGIAVYVLFNFYYEVNASIPNFLELLGMLIGGIIFTVIIIKEWKLYK